MVKIDISYSSDDGRLSRKDIDITSEMSEQFFKMKKDPSQMAATIQTRDWIYRNAANCLNVIRNNGEIVGYTFLVPCSKKLMNDFVSKKIDEAKLIGEIEGSKLPAFPESIYLCASIVKEEFRGQGLATIAFTKLISKMISRTPVKPVLFYWQYSNEGGKLAKRVAAETGLELIIRK